MREAAQFYHSKTLGAFVLELESRYKIQLARDKYHKLVNFSANNAVPYHQWFIYREGFSGALIAELIRMSEAEPGECILDPFCGSGTTNVVGVWNGYDSLGLDVNPMSAFLANTKMAHFASEDLKQAEAWNREAVKSRDCNFTPGCQEIDRYFSPGNLRRLTELKSYVENLPDCKAKELLQAAFLSIILDCSERKRDGNGLKIRPSRVKDVGAFFAEKVNLMVEDIRENQPANNVVGLGLCDTASRLNDVFQTHWPGKKAGAIIFSPPYANSFDYFESYKLELIMGGYAQDMGGIRELRKKAVRSFIGGEQQAICDPYVEWIAKEIEDAIPVKERETGKKDARTRKVPGMIRGYFFDMREVIRQCSLALASGRKTYIVVDQSAYCGKLVPTDLLLAYFGEQEGFQVGKIIDCRAARTSTQQLNKYPYLKNELRGSIVELIKK